MTDSTDAHESELDAGLTPEELAAERAAAKEALRRLHVRAECGSRCDWCGEPFPCPDVLAGPTG